MSLKLLSASECDIALSGMYCIVHCSMKIYIPVYKAEKLSVCLLRDSHNSTAEVRVTFKRSSSGSSKFFVTSCYVLSFVFFEVRKS